MRTRKNWIVAGVLFGLALTFPALAGAQAKDAPKHTVGVFGGGSHVDSETEFHVGLLYEYRPIPLVGLGPMIDYTPSAFDDGMNAFVGALHLHPWRGLRLTAGAGAAVVYDHHVETDFLARVGAAYEFEVGPIGLMPTLNFDFFDSEQAVIFGLTVVKGF
ncbi:MAG: hypothetical protein ACQGVC_11780 [Myxococcota bacterium]